MRHDVTLPKITFFTLKVLTANSSEFLQNTIKTSIVLIYIVINIFQTFKCVYKTAIFVAIILIYLVWYGWCLMVMLS